MKQYFIIMMCVFSSGVSLASAETVTFKNGQKVEGKILENTSKIIKIEVAGVPLTYDMDEVVIIDEASSGEKVTSEIQYMTIGLTEDDAIKHTHDGAEHTHDGTEPAYDVNKAAVVENSIENKVATNSEDSSQSNQIQRRDRSVSENKKYLTAEERVKESRQRAEKLMKKREKQNTQ